MATQCGPHKAAALSLARRCLMPKKLSSRPVRQQHNHLQDSNGVQASAVIVNVHLSFQCKQVKAK